MIIINFSGQTASYISVNSFSANVPDGWKRQDCNNCCIREKTKTRGKENNHNRLCAGAHGQGGQPATQLPTSCAMHLPNNSLCRYFVDPNKVPRSEARSLQDKFLPSIPDTAALPCWLPQNMWLEIFSFAGSRQRHPFPSSDKISDVTPSV